MTSGLQSTVTPYILSSRFEPPHKPSAKSLALIGLLGLSMRDVNSEMEPFAISLTTVASPA